MEKGESRDDWLSFAFSKQMQIFIFETGKQQKKNWFKWE